MIIKVCDPRQTKVAAGSQSVPKRRTDANLGRSMKGLIRYLVGPGENNEHTNPTLVAASGTLGPEWSEALWSDPLWGTREVAEFARQLNAPVLEKRARGEIAEDRAWVLHVVIAMPPEERLPLSQWGEIASDYIGLVGLDDSGGKPSTRWAAFHHGQSKNGSDHIHIAVNMVREDGTWAENYQIQYRSQQARLAIEQKYGFAPIEQAAQQRDVTPFTVNDAHRNSERVVDPVAAGAGTRVYRETDVEKLRRIMSAAAAGTDNEAEYVRALWSGGVLTRPRFAEGTRDVVTGYSVSLRPPPGQTPQWFGGGRVRADLTLPKLRERWSDSPNGAAAAAQAWRRYSGTSVPPPEQGAGAPGAAVAAHREVSALGAHLRDLDPAKVDEWRRAADAVGGAYAAWSLRNEPGGRGPLTSSMDALYRAAWAPHRRGLPGRLPVYTGVSRAVRLMAQASGSDDALGWLAVLQQLSLCVNRIAEAHRARREAEAAEYLLRRAHDGLRPVHDQLVAAGAAGRPDSSSSSAGQPGRTHPTPGRRPPVDPARDRDRGR